jgi:glycine/D-amino acid oxidase-like deaminating enzyme
MLVQTIPYWLEGMPSGTGGATAGDRPDVLVIGGVVTGCSCALQLAQAGARVRVHEAGRIGGGASGRNGGFALRGMAMPYDEAVARLGHPAAHALMLLTEHGLDRIERIADDAMRRVGSLRLATDARERRRLEAEHAALTAAGFDVAWIDELDAPLDRLYAGALLHPTDGAIHPGRWLQRLAAAARAAGAELVEESGLTLDEAAELADTVVVATDGYTSALLPELAAIVRPTRGQMLATEPLDTVHYARPHYARDGFDYWQQLPDGRLVLGGCRDASIDAEWTADDATTPAVQGHLDRLLAQLAGRTPTVTHRWSGAWGTTADGLPLVGRLRGRDGVWIAAGYSGHGNVLGFVCGALVADAIGGRLAPELALLDPARFD